MTGQREALASALEQAADAAQEVAAEQGRAAVAARDAAQEVRRDTGEGPSVSTVLHLFVTSVERLSSVAGLVRRAWAAAMAAEGLSRRAIAARMGVTHQRVSAVLARHHRVSEPEVPKR